MMLLCQQLNGLAVLADVEALAFSVVKMAGGISEIAVDDVDDGAGILSGSTVAGMFQQGLCLEDIMLRESHHGEVEIDGLVLGIVVEGCLHHTIILIAEGLHGLCHSP